MVKLMEKERELVKGVTCMKEMKKSEYEKGECCDVYFSLRVLVEEGKCVLYSTTNKTCFLGVLWLRPYSLF